MKILKHQRKGPHLNTLERFDIHKEATQDNHLNDDHTVLPNRIFEAIHKITSPLLTTGNRKNPAPETEDNQRSPTAHKRSSI
jgi:hypothetical protein